MTMRRLRQSVHFTCRKKKREVKSHRLPFWHDLPHHRMHWNCTTTAISLLSFKIIDVMHLHKEVFVSKATQILSRMFVEWNCHSNEFNPLMKPNSFPLVPSVFLSRKLFIQEIIYILSSVLIVDCWCQLLIVSAVLVLPNTKPQMKEYDFFQRI